MLRDFQENPCHGLEISVNISHEKSPVYVTCAGNRRTRCDRQILYTNISSVVRKTALTFEHFALMARPLNGGNYCRGERKRFRSCNAEACPEDGAPFRDVQCSRLDEKVVKIKGVPTKLKWTPLYKGNSLTLPLPSSKRTFSYPFQVKG